MKARVKKPGVRSTDPEEEKKKRNKGATVRRNKKGDLESTRDDRYYHTTEKENLAAKAKTGDRSFSGAPAPRTGGSIKIRKDGPLKGGTKSMIRKAKRRVRNNSASKAAKRSAIRAYNS